MTNELKINGYTITVQGHDFSGNERDFDAVCAAAETALSSLPADALDAIVWDAEADAYHNPDDTRALEACDTACHATLSELGWHKPDVPFVTITARI